jgi:hypothetical protein
MIASSSFPVDSLRSPSFTTANGVSPSIMDYARQNYVAQPGDGVTRFVRQIGPYDHYAINWGYRVIPAAATARAEAPILDRWIVDRAGDPRFRYFGGDGMDPNAQTEDIGDNAMAASTLGIANLQRVLPRLPEWTATPGESWDDLAELYGELVSMHSRYVGHVITWIGGVHRDAKATDQAGPVFRPVAVADQRAAVQFLVDQVFDTPLWLVDADVLRRIEGAGALDRIRGIQSSVLSRVLDAGRMQRMVETAVFAEGESYLPVELLRDVREAVWSELGNSTAVDPWRRQLQRLHLERLVALATAGTVPTRGPDPKTAEARPLARAELVTLRAALVRRIARGGDAATMAHLRDAEARAAEVLEPR